MTVYVNVNGVIHTASGRLTLASVPKPAPSLPPRNNAEITPTLSAPTGGGHTAFATSEYSEAGITAAAWRAFNKQTGNGWAVGWSSTSQPSASAPQILQIDMPAAAPCYSYNLTNRSDANTLCPNTWTFEGWNGSAWSVLHSANSISFADGETKAFNVTSPGVYSKYRWCVTAGGALCQIAEARVFS
jgi:hypothetical protein